jgi:hypothetical protein
MISLGAGISILSVVNFCFQLKSPERVGANLSYQIIHGIQNDYGESPIIGPIIWIPVFICGIAILLIGVRYDPIYR